MANMQPVMDHNHTVMTVCNKVTLPRIIFCFSRWISSFQGGVQRAGKNTTGTFLVFPSGEVSPLPVIRGRSGNNESDNGR